MDSPGALRAEMELARKELDSFFELSLDMLAIASFEGFFTRLNASWERTLGWTREELMSCPFTEFVHPDDYRRTEDETVRLMEGQDSINFENRWRRKGGGWRVLSWTAASSGGKFYAVARDVTERRRLENLKTEITHHVNHELRTPLASQLMALKLLEEDLEGHPNDRVPQAVRIARRSAEHMKRMVTDLLDVTKAETDKLSVVPEACYLPELAADVVAAMTPIARERTILLELAQRPVPPALADQARVRQILTNLLDNALKYTPAGGRVAVSLAPAPEAGFIRLAVKDTGPGLEPKDVARVFDRLYQTANVARGKVSGLGLGLAICKELVERQGGKIGVETAPGKGCEFWFTLPASAA